MYANFCHFLEKTQHKHLWLVLGQRSSFLLDGLFLIFWGWHILCPLRMRKGKANEGAQFLNQPC